MKNESGWNTRVSDHDKSSLKWFGFIKWMDETWVIKQIYKKEWTERKGKSWVDRTKRQNKNKCIDGVIEVNNLVNEHLQIYSIYTSVKRATIASLTATGIT